MTLRTPITRARPRSSNRLMDAAGGVGGQPLWRMSDSASARLAADAWNMPRTAEVTVLAPGLRTPRIDMHRCLDDDDHPARRQRRVKRVRDLRGQPLLHLWPLGVEVDEPSELRQAGNPPVGVGDVADVRHPVPGHQVMLAHRVDRDVPDDHELLVVLVEDRGQHLGGVGTDAGEDLGVRPGHPLGGVAQAVAVGILTDRDQNLADGCGHARLVDAGPLRHLTHRPRA